MNELSAVNKNAIEATVNAGGIWSTADAGSVQGKKLLYKATQGVDNKISDYLNTPITVVDMMFIQGTLKLKNEEGNLVFDEETGESVSYNRPMVVLIDEDGYSYGSFATGIFRSACAMAAIFASDGHFDEPLTVIPRSKPCEKGHTYVLEVQ